MASFISILSTFNIIGASTAFALGTVSYNWINSFMLTFIKPLLLKPYKNNINNIKLKLLGFNFEVGNFLLTTIDLILVLLFIFFVLQVILRDIVTRIIKDKNEHPEKMSRFLEDISSFRVPIIQR